MTTDSIPNNQRRAPDAFRSKQTGFELMSATSTVQKDPIREKSFWHFLDGFDKYTRTNRKTMLALGIALTGTLDFLTGHEASLAMFYVIPVFLAGWSLGLRPGLLFALAASATLVLSNWLAGQTYTAIWILLWNIAVRGVTFAAVAGLAAALREQLDKAHQLALTDPLTGAYNRRAFYREVATELARTERSPSAFSLAYIDVDDFKQINDRLGHSVGDEVLKIFVSTCGRSLRLQDMTARLGGDEFAILMPGTDVEALRLVLSRLEVNLKNASLPLAPVTFSIGGIAFSEPASCVNSTLRLVDALMYEAKSSGKNRIRIARYPDPELPRESC
jgi:diguanylate cyclase (GGDEF)-like protein